MTKKEKHEIMITGILILVLLIVGSKTLFKMNKNKPVVVNKLMPLEKPPFATNLQKVENKEGTVQEKAQLKTGNNVEKKYLFWKLDESTKDLISKRDPFLVASVSAEGESVYGVYLSGIVWDVDNPAAIINEMIVKVGDTIEDYTVIGIKPNSVILSNDKANFELVVGE